MTEEQSMKLEKASRRSKSDLRDAIRYLEQALEAEDGSVGRVLRIKDALDLIENAKEIEMARRKLGL